MNLYLITQSKEMGYDTYDSAVVAAPTAKAARQTHPDGGKFFVTGGAWCCFPREVTAEFIGKAKLGTKAGVICASFNAG